MHEQQLNTENSCKEKFSDHFFGASSFRLCPFKLIRRKYSYYMHYICLQVISDIDAINFLKPIHPILNQDDTFQLCIKLKYMNRIEMYIVP